MFSAVDSTCPLSRSRAAIEPSTAFRPAWPISRVRWTVSPTSLAAGRPGGGLGDLIDGGDGLGDGGGLLLGARGLLGGAGEDLGAGRGELRDRLADRPGDRAGQVSAPDRQDQDRQDRSDADGDIREEGDRLGLRCPLLQQPVLGVVARR